MCRVLRTDGFVIVVTLCVDYTLASMLTRYYKRGDWQPPTLYECCTLDNQLQDISTRRKKPKRLHRNMRRSLQRTTVWRKERLCGCSWKTWVLSNMSSMLKYSISTITSALSSWLCLLALFLQLADNSVVDQTKISGSVLKSKSLEKTLSGSGAREPMPNPDTPENYPKRSGVPCIVPPPPPPVLQPPPSPLLKTPSMAKPSAPVSESVATASNATPVSNDAAEDLDEDFGDFQAAWSGHRV
jgi:hypothetical protein